MKDSNIVQETTPIVFACMTTLQSFLDATLNFFENLFEKYEETTSVCVDNWSPILKSSQLNLCKYQMIPDNTKQEI